MTVMVQVLIAYYLERRIVLFSVAEIHSKYVQYNMSTIVIESMEMPQMSSTKVLEISVDESLNWNKH